MIRRFAAFLMAAFLLSACGQKGPLYLPGNPSEISTEVPVQELPATNDQEDGEDADDKSEAPSN
jgi:predicted small lipoprotein YifL